MLSSAKSYIIGSINLLYVIICTLFWAIPVYFMALTKVVIRVDIWNRFCVETIFVFARAWRFMLFSFFKLTLNITWDIQGNEGLSIKEWYFINSNHQTWTDILILLKAFMDDIPFLRFFIKQELIWVPVIGTGCWAMDMPFMKRYSKEYLKKHPEMKGKDLETTREACQRYRNKPVSILNFIEGTRFSPEKHARQKSPYQYLLRPKAGGFAYAIHAMNGIITTLLDVTIVYSGKRQGAYPVDRYSLWEFLSGKVSQITIQIKKMPIPEEFIHGDYSNNPDFRERFQNWVTELWEIKDDQISEILNQIPSETTRGDTERASR